MRALKILASLFFIVLFSCENPGDWQCRKWTKDNLPQEKYSGTIVRKFIDTPNKATEKIVLADSSIHYLYNYDMFLKAKARDIVIKNGGTLKYILVEGVDTFIYYPMCDDAVKDF